MAKSFLMDPKLDPPQNSSSARPGASFAAGLRDGVDPALSLSFLSVRSLLTTDRVRADALLAEYFEPLRKSFPDPNEAPSLERTRAALNRPITHDVNIAISAAATNGPIVGGIHWQYYNLPALNSVGGPVRVALIEYIWNHSRLGKVHHQSFVADRIGEGIRAIVAEINDPFLMSADQKTLDAKSGMTSEARVAWWEKRGYFAIDAPYMQAAIRPDTGSVDHLIMAIKPLGEPLEFVSRSAYLQLIHTFFSGFLPGQDIDSNPTFRAIAEQTVNQQLSLIPLSQRRSFIRE